MPTADQAPDTPAPGGPAPETPDDEVSDTGGDSDPGASRSAPPTGEEQAAKNRDEESPV